MTLTEVFFAADNLQLPFKVLPWYNQRSSVMEANLFGTYGLRPQWKRHLVIKLPHWKALVQELHKTDSTSDASIQTMIW